MNLNIRKLAGMTRRDFFKGSGVAAVALGAGGAALGTSPYSRAQQVSNGETVHEPARDIKVSGEADVVVVGEAREALAQPWRLHERERKRSLLRDTGTWAAWAPAGWLRLFRT